MKNLLFLFFACSLILSSCTKSGDDNCDAQGDCFWMTIDGEEFISDGTIVGLLTVGTSETMTFASLGFGLGGSDGFQMILSEPEVGTTTSGTLSWIDSEGNAYAGFLSNVDITNYDKDNMVIEGTFEATVDNSENNTTAEITSGYFKGNF